MKNTSSLKSLSAKTLNTQLNYIKKIEKQLLVELDNRLHDRQQKLKAKVKDLTGLDRVVALFKPITTKQAIKTINSVRSLLSKDAAKVPNLRFYHKLNLGNTVDDTHGEVLFDVYTRAPKIFAMDARGNVYEYVEFNHLRHGKLQFLGRTKA
jgi:hypothetical protein